MWTAGNTSDRMAKYRVGCPIVSRSGSQPRSSSFCMEATAPYRDATIKGVLPVSVSLYKYSVFRQIIDGCVNGNSRDAKCKISREGITHICVVVNGQINYPHNKIIQNISFKDCPAAYFFTLFLLCMFYFISIT